MNLRRALPAVVLLGIALFVFLRTINQHDPIGDWLVWRYLGLGALALGWAGSCLSFGFFLGGLLGLHRRPAREGLTLSFALGVLAFALATVLVGLVHGLGGGSFVVLPLVFLAAGGRALFGYLRRYVRRVRRLRGRLSVGARLAAAYGGLCLAGLYLTILTPGNVLYDARWYHLPIAEHYASQGAVGPFTEGWFLGTLPHLASWLYTWAFTLPFAGLVERIELAAHLEYVLLVATVLSLPVLIDLLLRRPRLRASWAAFFLFPGVLLYDSGLGCGADHVLAFWAVPIFVATLRFWRRPSPHAGVLAGALLAGAALTKYQGLYLLLVPLAVIALRLRRSWRAVAGAAAAFVAVTSAHWLLNWVWHGNPLYPMAYGLFGGSPMEPTLTPEMRIDAAFQLEGTLGHKLWETAKAIATFGFQSYDWITFHGERPVYGSLFLPALVLLPLIQFRRVVLLLAGASLAGIAAWFWTYHQDRYLQALTPWLAAFTLVSLAGAWRELRLARPLVLALVALQVLACADIYFLPTHAMTGSAVLKSIELITSGHRKALAERAQTYSSLVEAQSFLPKEARVLVHETHLHLGLGRPSLHDSWGRQGGIAYGHWADSGTVWRKLKALGATHVTWLTAPMNLNALGEDVVFHHFVQQLPGARRLSSGMMIAPLPEREPVSRAKLAVLGCTLEYLTARELDEQLDRLNAASCAGPQADVNEALANADVIVVDGRRFPSPPLTGFALLFTRGTWAIWGRTP